MNTHGHEEVAKNAGLPLLQDAFGKDERSLRALYLGNWLTDVSQAVDPVSYASAATKLKRGAESVVDAVASINKVVDQLLGTIFEVSGLGGKRVLRALRPQLQPDATKALAALHGAIDFLFGDASPQSSPALATFFRDSFLIAGYFKFVHPDTPSGPPRMNFECFMDVFGTPSGQDGMSPSSPAEERFGAYTQYYPHEHFDRPEIFPAHEPPIFEPGEQTPQSPFRIARGKQSGTRSQRESRDPIDPDLYSYLRDNIEMTAGLLGEVDLAFEHAITDGFGEDDPNWYRTLAKLGHALHQIEDFFAHSNWIELVVERSGPGFIAKAFPKQTKLEVIDRAYTTYWRRLKRHLTTPLADPREHPNEDWVVTGYFDFRDTIISLAHISEELWGGDVSDPFVEGHALGEALQEAAEKPSTVSHQVQKVLRDTFAFLTNPQAAVDDRANDVARLLKDKFEPDIEKLRRPGVSSEVAAQIARETEHFQQAPPEIRRAFLNVIVEGTRVYTVGKYTSTIYEAIMDIAGFIRNPLAWLAQWLPKELKERLSKALKYYGRELFYDWIGASRIGCHSLIAKDHGSEPMYKQQRECATAVHWYIVKTLLRWKDVEGSTYIDWLELLEYFLRNPLPPHNARVCMEGQPIPITILHIVKFRDQLKCDDLRHSLEARYRPTAVSPSQFNWRTIADVNFNTAGLSDKEAEEAINHILRDKAWGTPITPSYA